MRGIIELVNAERRYYAEIGKVIVDIPNALEMNRVYSDKLFDLYETLKNPDEKNEIEYELNYLIEQAKAIKKIQAQLNQAEETA